MRLHCNDLFCEVQCSFAAVLLTLKGVDALSGSGISPPSSLLKDLHGRCNPVTIIKAANDSVITCAVGEHSPPEQLSWSSH